MGKDETLLPDRPTEQVILEAARKVFTRKGYAAARMEDIAVEAGINRALLHYYYRSKEKLFEMVFDENIRMFYGNFISILNTPTPFDIRIRNLVAAEVDMLIQHPDLPLFVINEISRNPGLLDGKINLLPVKEFMSTIARVLDEEAAKGTIRRVQPHHVMLHLMSLCVFPFVARPMFLAISGIPAPQFDVLMQERKAVIAQTILDMLKPERP